MIRLIATATIAVLANALALIVSASVLEDMSLSAVGFFVALGIYTLTAVLVEPLMRQVALKNAPALLGSSALLATLVSLLLTSLFGDALEITGLTTWVLATVLVWAIGLAGRMLLPMIIFKKALANAADRQS